MAKPIRGIPPLRGKAAEWMTNYLETATPDPRKREQLRKDQEIVEKFVSLSELKARQKPRSQ